MDENERSSSSSPKRRSKSRSKSPGKHKSRSKSRSKSPGKHKSRSKSRSKSPGKHKSSRRNNSPGGGWWDLENDPDLIAALEAEGLRDKELIAQQEELLERRAELVAKFKEAYMKKQQEESRGRGRGGGLAQRYLQQVQQKERANKPVILDNVRAKPLKIDVFKWEAPKYKKDTEEKTLIKNTARNHFLFKEDKEKPIISKAGNKAATTTAATTNATAMIIKAFEPVQYNRGNTIIHQGQKDDHMYVVEDGTVQFQVDDITVATGGKGTTFGDQNLLYSSPAKASVVAAESIKIFRLHQDTYRGILQQKHVVEQVKAQKKAAQSPPTSPTKRGVKPIYAKDTLSNNKSSLLDEEWWKNSKRVQIQIAIRDALSKIQQDELERIRVLGEGQFGEVWLVAANIDVNKDKLSLMQRHEFALKLQSTHDEMREEMAVQAIKMEIQAMKDLSDHPFVSTLYKSYETEESMDMLLGLIPGGELWDVIHKENEATGEWFSGIAEGDARFYSMVVADTLGYLHSRNYIFRDLKPENIMIDNKGYPVIVDFGFCKFLSKGARKDKSFTFCGTPNYVSPEIVKNSGHNAAADYWALGIVIFEMIEGENPFYYDDMEQMELYRSICEDPPEKIDEKVHSKQVIKLVNELLVKDPKERIGTQNILTHSWYDGLSLKKLRGRKIKAPWVPPSSGKEGEDDDDDDDEEEKERQRRQEEELQRLEQEELQRQEERRRRQRQEMEELRRKEEEEEELRRRKQRQKELEEQRRREEEKERQRLEKLRIQKEKEEEERRRREEEEEAARKAAEERERRRLEELRIQKELEEQRRREEEEEEEEAARIAAEEKERQRLEKLRLQREREEEERGRLKEEERRRLEEEERQRLEELRIQKELEEQRRRQEEEEEEEEAARKAAEEKERRRLEKLRLQREREEEERRRKEEEERQRLEELRIQKELEEQRRRQEEEEREKQAEAERVAREKAEAELAAEKAEAERIAAEEARLRALEEERIAQEKAEEAARFEEERIAQEQAEEEARLLKKKQHRRNKEKEPEDEMELDDVFRHNDNESMPEAVSPGRGADRSERVRSLHQSYNGFTSPGKSPKRSIEDLISPVPKGIVAKMINENAKKSPMGRQSNPANKDSRKAGLVAKRLSAAKKKEKPENIPSLFSSFSLFDD